MAVTRDQFYAALDFLVSIEPDPEEIDIEYDVMMAPYKAEIAEAESIIRSYGEQIAHNGLEYMQDELQLAINRLEYMQDELQLDHQATLFAMCVITSTVNRVWDGCGEWQA